MQCILPPYFEFKMIPRTDRDNKREYLVCLRRENKK